jgi:hypothetical protein
VLKVVVEELTIDTLTNMPIVVLKDPHSNRALPIWIGSFEANAIAMEMEQVVTPRPLTHELIKNMLAGLHATVSRVVVNDLRENTFYAQIFLLLNGEEVMIDARPSDAIALSLRLKVPLFVREEVFAKVELIDLQQLQEEQTTQRVKEWLETVKPEDFGGVEE